MCSYPYRISHIWNLFKLSELNPLTNEYTMQHKGMNVKERKRERERMNKKRIWEIWKRENNTWCSVAWWFWYHFSMYCTSICVSLMCFDNKCNRCFNSYSLRSLPIQDLSPFASDNFRLALRREKEAIKYEILEKSMIKGKSELESLCFYALMFELLWHT